jgi:hypothetical protein
VLYLDGIHSLIFEMGDNTSATGSSILFIFPSLMAIPIKILTTDFVAENGLLSFSISFFIWLPYSYQAIFFKKHKS